MNKKINDRDAFGGAGASKQLVGHKSTLKLDTLYLDTQRRASPQMLDFNDKIVIEPNTSKVNKRNSIGGNIVD